MAKQALRTKQGGPARKQNPAQPLKTASDDTVKTAKPVVGMKYANPANPAETWTAGSKAKRPEWLKAALENTQELEPEEGGGKLSSRPKAVLEKTQEVEPPAAEGADTLTQEQWKVRGAAFGKSASSLKWDIGRWLCDGEERWPKWGEMYDEAVELTGYGEPALRDMKWVATRFPLSCQHDKLKWTHHREAAPLDMEDAERLLTEAEKEGWSCKQVRQAVATIKPTPKPGAADPDAAEIAAAITAAAAPAQPAAEEAITRNKPKDFEKPAAEQEEEAEEEARAQRVHASYVKSVFISLSDNVEALADDATIKEIGDCVWEQRADPEVRERLAAIIAYSAKVEEFLKTMKELVERIKAEDGEKAQAPEAEPEQTPTSEAVVRQCLTYFAKVGFPNNLSGVKLKDKGKLVAELIERGLLEKKSVELKGKTRAGYVLTDKGRDAYAKISKFDEEEVAEGELV